MNPHTTGFRRLFLVGFLFFVSAQCLAQYPCAEWRNNGQLASSRWNYSVELKDPQKHLLQVSLHLNPTSPTLQVQMPVWNALYQIRDFAEHVNWIRASDPGGKNVPVRQIDKTTWSAPNAVEVTYEIYVADSGPFGAEYNTHHAFLNLAQVLVYPVGERDGRIEVSFSGITSGWRIGTPLVAVPSAENSFCADSYDHLVDSPVEIGEFRELRFEVSGGHYRVLIHANPDDYDGNAITEALREIVSAETVWMQDRPYQQYTFIYHLPRGVGRGGMEHAYSTAIETSTARLADDPLSFASVSAHEFFHLWNVKRIRPESLEPIDYTKENYTRALWFCEGVDSAVSEYMLVRAGLEDQKTFLERLALQIRSLETRPAHLTQSAEESSLNAWLEKYPYYRTAGRSVNYYNKGLILGVMLDLQIRSETNGAKSLRDLFQWMNDHFAKAKKFYRDSDGVKDAAEAITGANFDDFFRRYVSGTDQIPYDDFLQFVGLRLEQKKVMIAYAGFSASNSFGPNPVVTAVDSGSEAEKAGLHLGDIILSVNGQEPGPELEDQLASLQPGDTVKLKVSTRDRTRDVKVKLGSREDVDFQLVERDDATPEQRVRRAAWVSGDSETSGRAH